MNNFHPRLTKEYFFQLLPPFSSKLHISKKEISNNYNSKKNRTNRNRYLHKTEKSAGNGIRTHADREVHGLSRPAR